MAQITVTLTTTPSTSIPAIPIGLQVHAEARGLDDLWTGRTNADTRRKLQNRLNQRAFRRRKAAEKASKVQVFDLDPTPPLDTPEATASPQQRSSLRDCRESCMPLIEAPKQPKSVHDLCPPGSVSNIGLPILTASWCRPFESIVKTQTQAIAPLCDALQEEDESTVSFEESFLKNLKPKDFYRMPADDHLLSLMYYNVFRALTTNVRLLGLDTVLMHTDNYPSPFITGTANGRHIPPHLQPTLLQRTMPHHPCFDVFPDPVVRDQGIKNTHLLTHGKLCMTLAGRNTWFENDRSRRSGLVIWGAPEDANSWEVTEGFVANWGWLVKGSLMLQYSTNKWRAVRGEPAIFFA